MGSTLDNHLPIVLLSPELNITLDSLALVLVLVNFPVSNSCFRARLSVSINAATRLTLQVNFGLQQRVYKYVV